MGRGVFKAAKETDAALIMELARTECNQNVGYTGLTPATLSSYLQKENDLVGHDIWVLHADHIQIKEGTPEEITEVFNFKGRTIEEELAPNIKATIEVAKFIQSKMDAFGLEVEVGEIGKKDTSGMVLTRPTRQEAIRSI